MTAPWLVLVESNTTGSGRLFCSCARDLGMRPVLLVRDPARYPYLAADRIDHLVTCTGDVARVLGACASLAAEAPIAGVTSSSEYYIGMAAQAAAGLGLPHPDVDAIRACRDKYEQRVRLAVAGVPGPAFAAAGTPGEAARAAARIGFPVVVKPGAGTGSIAVRRCEDTAEAADAARQALAPDADPALPPQRLVLVEEYLTGAEYSAELIDDQVIGITRKRLGAEPYFLETGHDFPASLGAADTKTLGDTAVAAVRALGLAWGGAHVELRYEPNAQPCVVEVNPRLAGGMIPRVVQAASGIDMIWHVVAAAAGQPRAPQQLRQDTASIRFLIADRTGTITVVDGVGAARRVPGVVEVSVACVPGQQVMPRHSFRDRLGYVIAAAPDPAAAARAADLALTALRIVVRA